MEKQFRNYENSPSVKNTYRLMHQNQNLLFVTEQKNKYASHAGYTDINGNKIYQCLTDVFPILDQIIDESDPDADFPQIYHAYQTGEALRKTWLAKDGKHLKSDIDSKSLFSKRHWQSLPTDIQLKFSGQVVDLYPHIEDWSWLPLVGFIHDVGKVLASQEWGALPQWAVVGDTFPVGAPFSRSNIYSNCLFYETNSDLNIKQTHIKKFGIYEKNCGFDNVHMSFGHDEYCYAVLNRDMHDLPGEGLGIIRYHSFYAWHTPPEDKPPGYMELANDKDYLLLPLLKLFQKCDLYSKSKALPDLKSLANYYEALLEKFMPSQGKLLW